VEEYAHEEHIVGELSRLADNRQRVADLVGRQRVERVEQQRHHRRTSVKRLGERADASMLAGGDRGIAMM